LREQYRVIFATEGNDALDQAVRFLPDLILLDIIMPEMDGFEVCRRLKDTAATTDIPVIFLSACAETEDIIQGFTLGAVDYVTKPFRATELLARVSTHLQLRQARREVVAKNAALEILNTELATSLEQNRMLLREVNHRVKNNLNVVCSLLSLQANQVKDPRDAALFAEARNRVTVMASIHEGLYRSTTLSSITAGEFFTTIAHNLVRSYDRREVHIQVECGGLSLGMDQLIPCGLIINELVTNALKYAFPEGQAGIITISLADTAPDSRVLTVRDNGIGMSAGFDPEQAESLGLILVTSLTTQLGGTLRMEHCGGAGFTIRFPAQ
jgi:two-component sensor histidine kinase